LSRAEKRAAVQRLLQEDPTRSNREIARLAGVSHVAVSTMRKEFERAASEQAIAEAKRIDIDTVPLSDLLKRIMAWPEERRVELLHWLERGKTYGLRFTKDGRIVGNRPWLIKHAEKRESVLQAIAEGESDFMIGQRLGVPPATVYTIRQRGY